MKRFGMWAAVAAFLVVSASFVNEAHAGSIGLMAAGAEDPVSGLSAARTLTSGTNHKYILADFTDNAADRCILWHFPMPPDYVAAGAISGLMNFINTDTSGGSPTGNMSFRVDLACVDQGENYSTVAFSAGTAVTVAGTSFTNILGGYTFTSGNVISSTCSPSDSVIVRLCRTGGDACTNNVAFVDLTLQY